MRPGRAWVRLGSGKRLDLISPRPGQWDDMDVGRTAAMARMSSVSLTSLRATTQLA